MLYSKTHTFRFLAASLGLAALSLAVAVTGIAQTSPAGRTITSPTRPGTPAADSALGTSGGGGSTTSPTRPATATQKPVAKPATTASSSSGAPAILPGSVMLGGTEYIDLIALGKKLGLTVAWTKPKEQAVMKNWLNRIECQGDSSELAINSMRVFSGFPLRMYKGSLWMSRIDVDSLFLPIVDPGNGRPSVPRLKVIALDAGHGGIDKGKVNTRVKADEKTLALDTAVRVKKLLEAQGYRVVMTRTTDKKIDLADRPEIAAKAGADLFISIHFNSVEQGAQRVSGVEVYRFTPRYQAPITRSKVLNEDKLWNPADSNTHWSAVAGYQMQKSLLADLGATDRGFKHHKFAVLRLARCPAILIEGGFLSNDTEARKILTPAYRQKLAVAIADGVKAYAGELDKARR